MTVRGIALLAAVLGCSSVARGATAASGWSGTPAWLSARAGTLVRVDAAPWFSFDEPEAALTASAASLRRNFSNDGTRPEDIVYEPVGVRARIVRVLPGAIALLRGTGGAWTAYAPLDRLVPDVPRGTKLVVAGGFAGFADFYPTLTTREANAGQLATGVKIVVLGNGVAPADPGTANRVRVFVRVLSGPLRGRIGWLEVPYTGISVTAAPHARSSVERACSCRLLSFGPA